jgi:hypothetical protein
MLIAKVNAEHDAHGGDAEEENSEGGEIIAGDFSGAPQNVSDEEIEERPENVDRRRGEPFPGRFGKR